MASEEVRWKMMEMQRCIAALTQDAELYEKEFQEASSKAQEVSKIISTLKTSGSDVGEVSKSKKFFATKMRQLQLIYSKNSNSLA